MVSSSYLWLYNQGEFKSSSQRRNSDTQPGGARRLQEELGGREITGKGRNVGVQKGCMLLLTAVED